MCSIKILCPVLFIAFAVSVKGQNTNMDILDSFSAKFITFVQGLRFLTDYIDGDPYYRTQYADHNLVRARVQFRLVE
ncbi:MAG: hypothetical protein ABI921_15695, partial [Panacibacter sp.]